MSSTTKYVLLCLCLGFFSCQVLKEPAAGIMRMTLPEVTQEERSSNLPKADYQLRVKDMDDNIISMEAYRGKVIFLNFWATWCMPCVAELPNINKLYEKYSNEVAFLLISDEPLEKVKKYHQRKKLSVPFYVIDQMGYVPAMYHHSALPTTFIINKQGELVRASSGAENWNSDTAIQLFDQLLAP